MEILMILGWVISVITAIYLGKGAIEKIVGTEEMKGNFNFMKLEKYRRLTGFGELFASFLLISPIAYLYGAILIFGFMSAAVVIHLSLFGGDKTHIPLLVGLGALVGAFLRLGFIM